MRSKKLQSAYEVAEAMDAKLKGDDDRLRGTVHIAHHDGTSLLFAHAFAEQVSVGEESWWFIFTEHHGVHVYSPDEVRVGRWGAEL